MRRPADPSDRRAVVVSGHDREAVDDGVGIAPRAEISRPSEAKAYLDLGVRHFCMGWDVSILFDWFKAEGGALRDLLRAG